MKRGRLAWPLSVPLMLGGTECAHWLAFWLVYPNRWERAQALQQSGHAYLSYWPVFAGIGLALLVAGLVYDVCEHARPTGRRWARRPPAALFASLPPLAFALQEHVESFVHTGSIAGVAESPTFLVGLVLQLPFALLAFLLARLLLRVAELVGRVLARPSRTRVLALQAWSCQESLSVGSLASLGCCPGRGPPLLT